MKDIFGREVKQGDIVAFAFSQDGAELGMVIGTLPHRTKVAIFYHTRIATFTSDQIRFATGTHQEMKLILVPPRWLTAHQVQKFAEKFPGAFLPEWDHP